MTSRDDRNGRPQNHADPAPLEPRRAAILDAVVTEYIGTAMPVGSNHVARVPGINVSSATVRAEMSALEQEGYLTQPHTSAGRVPTDKGYRFFVDHLAEPGVLGPAQRHKVRRFFDQVHVEMEEMLERASGLLSDLTSYAAVVVGPSHESAAVRSVQLVGLGSHVALLVVVLSDGAVEKRSVELGAEVEEGMLRAAADRLQAHMIGRPLSAAGPLSPSGDQATDALVDSALEAIRDLGRDEPDQIYVGGPLRLAAAFDAVETVRSVLGILEQQLVVVSLLRDVLDSGLSVAIGAEHGFEPLASCAVVVAPVMVDGRDGGAVGLLGPTRMNYPHALAVAHVVGEGLSERMTDVLSRGAAAAEGGASEPGAAGEGDFVRSGYEERKSRASGVGCDENGGRNGDR